MRLKLAVIGFTVLVPCGCAAPDIPASSDTPQPKEIIDLGALITEDLPERLWGKRFASDMGFDANNVFDVIHWEYADGAVGGSNSFYRLFNHGGPHVDAPNHVGLGRGVDSYSFEAFSGPLKVVDVSHFETGYTVPVGAFEGHDIRKGDIVAIYRAHAPPQTDTAYPASVTLTREAAEYLAEIPIRAFVTDGWSDPPGITYPGQVPADSEVARAIPIHHSFLSRGIPIYEAMFHLDRLLNKKNMYFVGPPLNIEDGDGMMVRPVVLVF
jgi:kynurenine formamidase